MKTNSINTSIKIVLLAMILATAHKVHICQAHEFWNAKKITCVGVDFIPVAVSLLNENSAWIAGETGEIRSRAVRIFLNNGFSNCEAFVEKDSSSYDHVYFENELKGWIVGSKVHQDGKVHGLYLQTNDAGKTWLSRDVHTTLVVRGYVESDFDRVIFTKSGNGFMLGRVQSADDTLHGIILRKDRLSETWAVVYEAEEGVFFNDIRFSADESTGWIISNNGTVLRADSLGLTWRPIVTGFDGSLLMLSIVSKNEVWITTESSNLIHTIDGGRSWEHINISMDNALLKQYAPVWFSGIYFDTAGNGWIGGSGGVIMRTSDKGKSWRLESSNNGDFLYEIATFGSKLVAIGKPSIFLTTIRTTKPYAATSFSQIVKE